MNYDNYVTLGRTLATEDKLEQAMVAYEQAIALNPQRPSAYGFLGNIHLKQGNSDQAIKNYYQSIALKAKQPFTVYERLSNALRAQGKIEEADVIYQQGKQLGILPSSNQTKPQKIVAQSEIGMKLATIIQSNELSMSKIMNFRSINSLDISKPHNESFHQHKNQYSYFGFIQIEIENCSPFVMFSCNDDIVAMTYYWYGSDSYERKSISEWVSRSIDSEVILDVGSFTGLYSLAAVSAKKSLENVKVYAFEPTRRVHARLLMNIQTNKLRNVIEPVNLAVSNCVEQVRFLQYRGDHVLGTGASFIDKGIESTSEEEIVDTISIDEFIEQEKIKPQLIKIDVEQAEVLALEGMRQTLKDCSPTILIEVAPKTIEQSASILTDHGYKLYVINEENQALINIHDAPNNKVQNILAEK